MSQEKFTKLVEAYTSESTKPKSGVAATYKSRVDMTRALVAAGYDVKDITPELVNKIEKKWPDLKKLSNIEWQSRIVQWERQKAEQVGSKKRDTKHQSKSMTLLN
jgi:hypothetical protein